MQNHTANKTPNGVIYYQYIYFHMLGAGLLDDNLHENARLNASLCSFFHSGILDRTGTLDQGFEAQVLNPFPDFSVDTQDDPSFAEVCDRRAIEIIELAKKEQRPIYVFWSGGIDSTTALVALLRNLEKKDIDEYLTVYLNQESINEYPEFYSDIIQPGLNMQNIDASFDFLEGNPVIVTGELGDQMFGSVTMIELLNIESDINDLEVLKKPYKTLLPKYIKHRLKTGNDENAKKLFEFLVPLIERCPWKIETIFDCLWWMNFTLKWQHVDLRFAAGFHNHLAELERNYNLCWHFFKSEDFQRWSVNNPDMKIKDTWDTYKFPAKEYIYKYTGDRDYMDNKQKVPSLSMREIQQSYHCFLLDNFTMVKAHDTQNIHDFRQRFGNSYNWVFKSAQKN